MKKLDIQDVAISQTLWNYHDQIKVCVSTVIMISVRWHMPRGLGSWARVNSKRAAQSGTGF